MIATAVFVLLFLNKLPTEKAKKSALMTKDNEDEWTRDIWVYRDFYLYNCTNSQVWFIKTSNQSTKR